VESAASGCRVALNVGATASCTSYCQFSDMTSWSDVTLRIPAHATTLRDNLRCRCNWVIMGPFPQVQGLYLYF
jgi:hypothetical protein